MVTIPDRFAGKPTLPLTLLVGNDVVGRLLAENPVVDNDVILNCEVLSSVPAEFCISLLKLILLSAMGVSFVTSIFRVTRVFLSLHKIAISERLSTRIFPGVVSKILRIS